MTTEPQRQEVRMSQVQTVMVLMTYEMEGSVFLIKMGMVQGVS